MLTYGHAPNEVTDLHPAQLDQEEGSIPATQTFALNSVWGRLVGDQANDVEASQRIGGGRKKNGVGACGTSPFKQLYIGRRALSPAVPLRNLLSSCG